MMYGDGGREDYTYQRPDVEYDRGVDAGDYISEGDDSDEEYGEHVWMP